MGLAMATGHDKQGRDVLVLRVQKSLRRQGLDDVSVMHLDERTVRLEGSARDASDCVVAVAVARTVPGVEKVVCEINVLV